MSDIGYLMGKLDEIHTDVKQLQIHVDNLRQESIERKAVSKFIFAALGIFGACIGWAADKLIKFN